MINHARTLLLNRDGAARPSLDSFLEEYVESDFVAVPLEGGLRNIADILIGSDDPAYQNFRLSQYMGILHSTEFESYVLALDTRVTYKPRNILDTKFGSEATPLNLTAESMPLFFVGRLSGTGKRLSFQWELEGTDTNKVQVTALDTGKKTESTVTFQDGLTSLVPLLGQPDLFVRIAASSDVMGAKWQVSALARPASDVTTLLQPLSDARAGIAELFKTRVEPYATFQKLWEKHAYLQYRLSGLLLAHIYRVEELRLNG